MNDHESPQEGQTPSTSKYTLSNRNTLFKSSFEQKDFKTIIWMGGRRNAKHQIKFSQNISLRERFKIKNSKKKLTNVSFVCVCVGRKWSNVSFFLEFFSPNYSLIDNSLSE